jgi:hypothetical protein
MPACNNGHGPVFSKYVLHGWNRISTRKFSRFSSKIELREVYYLI